MDGTQFKGGATQPNPAARLATYLDALKKQQPNDKLRVVWAKVFNVDQQQTGELLQRVADLVHLAREARSAVENAIGDDDPKANLYIEPYNKLERALSRLNFDTNAQQILNEIDATCVQGIHFGADVLNRLGLVGKIDEGILVELQKEVDGLSALILDSDLASEIKDLLTRRVEALRTAILEIRLRGAEAVEEALDALYGTLGRVQGHFPESGGKKLVKQMSKVLDIGYKLVAMAEKVPRLGAPVIKLLTSGEGAS